MILKTELSRTLLKLENKDFEDTNLWDKVLKTLKEEKIKPFHDVYFQADQNKSIWVLKNLESCDLKYKETHIKNNLITVLL
jgi:hypothetical protein